MKSNKQSFAELNKRGHPCCYYGEREDWLQVIGQSRDSKCLEESNFRLTLKALKKISEDDVEIERSGHWAVGWIEVIIINPANEAMVKEAQSILDALTDYPVVDDDDFSELEYETAAKYWDQCSVRERLQYVKKFGGDPHQIRFAKMSYYKLGNDDSQVAQRIYDIMRSDI